MSRWFDATGIDGGSTRSSTPSARRYVVASTRSPMSWWFRSPPQCPIISIMSGRSTARWSVIVFAFDGPTPMSTSDTPERPGPGKWYAGICRPGRSGSLTGPPTAARNASTCQA